MRVLRDLDGVVNRGKGDAAIWYHRGIVAWTLWERSRHQPPARGLDWTLLMPRADTSLRQAVELEPDNPEYFAGLSRFLIASGAFWPYDQFGVFTDQLKRARESGDSARIAATATEASRLYWIRWDATSCGKSNVNEQYTNMLRAAPVEGGPRGGNRNNPWSPRDVDYAGELDYLKAQFLAEEAYRFAPHDSVAFRRYAMMLADKMHWSELATFAEAHIHRSPSDAFAWMSLGLARHKMRQPAAARAAFDTALVRLAPDERRRLDRIERVLDPRESARLAVENPADRATSEAVYWRNADPLWSVEGTEPRQEFLARVAFAELRWTQEEISLNGVNTDVGNYYVRSGTRDPNAGCKQMMQAWYVWNDTTVLRGRAANWTSLTRMRVDSIPVQVARFRAHNDSTDVVIATLPPTAAISRAAQVKGPVRSDLWVLENGLTEVRHDSLRPAPNGTSTFVARFAQGAYVYRTEATADGSTRAARSTAGFITGHDARTGYSILGMGISDFLLGLKATPKRTPAVRWSDYDVTPAIGPLPPKAQLTLVWENYEFGNDNGSARYAVTVAVERNVTPQSRPGRVVASIVGRLGAQAQVTRTTDKVQFAFERSAPYAPTLVDELAISMGDSPPGTYVISLRVTDRVTGTQMARAQEVVVPAAATQPRGLYKR
ncbi:MAG TPA: hypothetical protein VE967_07630 [Gemmatimonadaceae bacterium]|nr:hypothetical protein [Gemmatimonadaceae bacterium]